MIYYILKKIELMGAENVLMVFHLFHILIKIYLPCRVKVGLKKIFTSQFQTYLLSTSIILFFSKFYTQFTINLVYVFKTKN